ncbi:MAG: hypothetical protein ACI4SF_11385 [Oscillospiraceae bacterium]
MDMTEEKYRENSRMMRELDRLYKWAFLTGAVPSAYVVINYAISTLALVMSVGIAGGAVSPLLFFLCLGHLILLYAAFRKNYKMVIAALLYTAFLMVLMLYIFDIGVLLLLPELASCVLWGVCIGSFKKLEYLKAQPGYPDFNYIVHTAQKEYVPNKEKYKDDHAVLPSSDMGEITDLPQTGEYPDEDIRRKSL